ncbi:MAG: hypothetical protein JNM81_05580 [Rhodospirillaceae bacterium]|nr:hypothetical protein [Rhodospirillaceae bacterium]
MKRFIALAAVLLLPAAGLMAQARPAQPQQPPITAPGITAPGITKDMLDKQAPQPPQLVCFNPGDVKAFQYRAATNSLRVTTSPEQNYDVSFFVPCGGLASTDALTFDGVTNDQVCGTGVESVVFYSTEQGPKRCSIRDVKQQPSVAHVGR